MVQCSHDQRRNEEGGAGMRNTMMSNNGEWISTKATKSANKRIQPLEEGTQTTADAYRCAETNSLKSRM